MTIAFVCPSSFNDYEAMEKELLKNNSISKITCATDTACNLVEKFISKHTSIEHYRETRGKKVFNLRKVVQSADKVLLFEYTDYDGVAYSLTQKALKYARELKRELQYVKYNRGLKTECNMLKNQNEYAEFFIKIKEFKEGQNKQKQRGLNDYNMVNVVRKETHEVGMHSNVIYSLIDPHGLHYQGDLFLNLFIENIINPQIDNFIDFGYITEVNKEEYTKENKRIDFTIKSDKYFIGIEMKIDHHDSKYQLSGYYKDLVDKAKEENIDKENVIIFYLTKFGAKADDISIDIKDSDERIKYKRISFENDILHWIDNCQEKVRNITNLNEAFNNYRDIVEKITGKYKSNIDTLDKLFVEKENLFLEAQKFHTEIEHKKYYLRITVLEREVFDYYRITRAKIANNFFQYELVKHLKKNLDNCYIIHSEFNTDDYKYKIIISNNTNKIIFSSKAYGTNDDYYVIKNNLNKVTKYRYRYSEKSINAYFLDNGKKAKEYYLKIIQDNL